MRLYYECLHYKVYSDNILFVTFSLVSLSCLSTILVLYRRRTEGVDRGVYRIDKRKLLKEVL